MFSFLTTSKVEYVDTEGRAVCDFKTTFCNIPIYRATIHTYNNATVQSLTKAEVKPIKTIKGF